MQVDRDEGGRDVVRLPFLGSLLAGTGVGSVG